MGLFHAVQFNKCSTLEQDRFGSQRNSCFSPYGGVTDEEISMIWSVLSSDGIVANI